MHPPQTRTTTFFRSSSCIKPKTFLFQKILSLQLFLKITAMAENSSRKRDLKGLNSSHPCSKVPKGSLPHSKNVPEISGGMLIPPQLRGRSNVDTEDISKLFVKKQADP